MEGGPAHSAPGRPVAACNQPADNLIDIHQTGVNLFNIAPSIQCFFIDACQEIPPCVLQNIDAAPGEPLIRPVNAAQLAKLDACLYLGSYTGKAAYGPGNDAPFFTQELLFCLESSPCSEHVAERRIVDGNHGFVGTALLAAGFYRAEIEKRKEIQFSVQGLTATFNADLCQFPGPPEAFVQVWCLPRTTMAVARLFVEDTDGQRSCRTGALRRLVHDRGDGKLQGRRSGSGRRVWQLRRYHSSPRRRCVRFRYRCSHSPWAVPAAEDQVDHEHCSDPF